VTVANSPAETEILRYTKPISRDLDVAWRKHAACVGAATSLFYPQIEEFDRGSPAGMWGREAQAKKICESCPVSRECLNYAYAAGERDGIWGGLTFNERRSLRRRNRKEGR